MKKYYECNSKIFSLIGTRIFIYLFIIFREYWTDYGPVRPEPVANSRTIIKYYIAVSYGVGVYFSY